MTTDQRSPPERVVPARVRVPPYGSVVPCGTDGRVLGLDPETALAVEHLPPGLAAMLDELVEPVAADALMARAAERGAALDAAEQLLDDLVRVGAVIDAAVVERRDRHRAESIVVVSGDGPLTVGVVLGLVRAGVGAVYTEVAGVVSAAELGTGHVDADRGRDRAVAIRDAVRRLQPEADAPAAPARLTCDLVVLADAAAPDPVQVVRLHARGSAHLPVRMRDGIGVIGPLVLPGRTACLGCLELTRAAHAPDWPSIAAQLTGRSGRADPAATAATAALGVAQALAALDATAGGGGRPPTWETSLELDATAGTILQRSWHPHPGCWCGAGEVSSTASGGVRHEPATSERTGEGETIME
jgi:bacteriocin biosynthesis cyclodehydratase domain-containing protein